MKLRYELDTGYDLESPKMSEEDAGELIRCYLEYVNNKRDFAGGYIKDGKHFIDMSHVIAITIIKR